MNLTEENKAVLLNVTSSLLPRRYYLWVIGVDQFCYEIGDKYGDGETVIGFCEASEYEIKTHQRGAEKTKRKHHIFNVVLA